MAQPSLYKSGNLWIYSNGKSEAIKTAPAGNYRRSVIGTMVAVFGKHNEFTLFSDKYIEVTTIQKSSTPGDNYLSVSEFIGATEDFFVSPSGEGGISINSGQVSTYENLPDPTAHSGEIWYVENASGGFLSFLGIYKYPKGLYSPNSSDVWEIVPLNVKVAEDALTLVNITSWTEYFNFATDIGVGDRVLFDGKIYINISGTQTSVSPPIDTTNWEASNEVTWFYPFIDHTQPKGVMTKMDGWNVISNKLTSEYPFPQYIGVMQNPYEGKYPLSTVSAKQIVSGIEFDNNDKNYYFAEFNIFTVKGFQYDQLIHIDPEGENKVVPINSFVSESNMISQFSIDKTIIEKGKKFRILSLISLPNNTTASLVAEYYYNTDNFSPSLPSNGGINQGNRGTGKRTMLVSYIDNTGVDRTTFMQSLTAGDKISVGTDLDFVEWTIQKVTVESNYVRLEVWTEQIASIEYVLSFSFYKIVDSDLSVVNDVDYWSTSKYSGLIQGVYGINVGYSDASSSDTARNISANIQEVDISDDWDIMSSESVSPISLNSGTSLVLNIDDWSIYFKSNSGVSIGDRIIYNNLIYENKTGEQTPTSPNLDLTNWGWPTTNARAIQFQTDQQKLPYSKGMLQYDEANHTVTLTNDRPNVSGQLLRELWSRSCNNSGSKIPDMRAVYISGINDGCPEISLVQSDEYVKSRFVGILTEALEFEEQGEVTCFGRVNNVDTSFLNIGSVFCSSDGLLTNTEPTGGSFIVYVGYCLVSDASNGSLFVNPSISNVTAEINDENGFPSSQRVASLISYDDTTRIFSIAPTDDKFYFYEHGIKYIKDEAQTVTLPNSSSGCVIYFDSGVLTFVESPSAGQIDAIIRNHCIVSYTYYNATQGKFGYVGNERHGFRMSPDTHSYLHFNLGARYVSGLGITDLVTDDSGDDDVDAQFGVESGVTSDEDLPNFPIERLSTEGLPIYYIIGPDDSYEVFQVTKTGFSVLTDIDVGIGTTGRLVYNQLLNGVWQLTVVPNNDFVNCNIVSIPDIDNARKQIAFIGQTYYPSLGTARAGSLIEIKSIKTIGNVAPEITSLGTVLFQTSNGYDNAVKARTRSTVDDDGNSVDYIDWRTKIIEGSNGTQTLNPKFSDVLFKVFDDADPTSIFSFIADNIATGTERQLTVQDKDGIIALLSDIVNASITSIQFNNTAGESFGQLNRDLVGELYMSGEVGINFTSPNFRISDFADDVGATVTVGSGGSLIPLLPANPPYEQEDTNAGPINVNNGAQWYDLGIQIITDVEYTNPTFSWEMTYNNNNANQVLLSIRLTVDSTALPEVIEYNVNGASSSGISGNFLSENIYPIGTILRCELMVNNGAGAVSNITGRIEYDPSIRMSYITGALTDDAPSASEINAIVNPAIASKKIQPLKSGSLVLIKDSTGSGKVYKCVYDGTDWHYTTTTLAL